MVFRTRSDLPHRTRETFSKRSHCAHEMRSHRPCDRHGTRRSGRGEYAAPRCLRHSVPGRSSRLGSFSGFGIRARVVGADDHGQYDRIELHLRAAGRMLVWAPNDDFLNCKPNCGRVVGQPKIARCGIAEALARFARSLRLERDARFVDFDDAVAPEARDDRRKRRAIAMRLRESGGELRVKVQERDRFVGTEFA